MTCSKKKFFDSCRVLSPLYSPASLGKSSGKVSVTSDIEHIYLGPGKCSSPKLGKQTIGHGKETLVP